MAALGRSRTIILGGVAIALLAALVVRQSGGSFALPMPDLQSEQQLRARIDSFRRVVSARNAIDKAYFDAVGGYAEAMAGALTFMPKGGEPKSFADKVVRDTISTQGAVRNLVVSLGEATVRSEGITEVPVSVSFVSGSQTALATVSILGMPEKGLLWEELTVAADAKAQTVSVTGRLSALVIEAAE